jgi:hypothetical protein
MPTETDELRELDARLLVRFCGWTWKRERDRGLCMLRPPGVGEWEPSPQWVGGPEKESDFLETLTTTPPPAERFADWETTGAVRYQRGRNDIHSTEWGPPHLYRSLDACGMLKAALISKGYDVECSCRPRAANDAGYWIEVSIIDPVDEICLSHHLVHVDAYSASAEAEAICRAADGIPEAKT